MNREDVVKAFRSIEVEDGQGVMLIAFEVIEESNEDITLKCNRFMNISNVPAKAVLTALNNFLSRFVQDNPEIEEELRQELDKVFVGGRHDRRD